MADPATDPYIIAAGAEDPHGTIDEVSYFRFAYSSEFSVEISNDCQLTGSFMGTDCTLIASQLLPATETV